MKDTILNNCYVGKSNRLSRKYNELLTNDMKSWLSEQYPDSCTIKESLYRLKNNIIEKPRCKNCGKKLEFKNNKYSDYCCNKCMVESEETKHKRKQTCLHKYGDKTYNNIDKRINTCMSKYGTKHYVQCDDFKEKYKHTCIKKYGVDNSFKSKEIINKILQHKNKEETYKHVRETTLKRYGVKSVLCLKHIRDKRYTAESKQREYETKRKNSTFNSSKTEDISYNIISEKYPNVVRQYNCDEYPFACDFYIPDLNVFIECQYGWTHGKHPYNKNNIEDINIVEKWKTKNTKYYNNAINTWTNRDVLKRSVAKENKLKYIEVWNIEELKTILDIGLENYNFT